MKTEAEAQAILDGIRPEAMKVRGARCELTAYVNQEGDLLIVGDRGDGYEVLSRITGSAGQKLDALIGRFPGFDHLAFAA